ncbi:hypothetical protein [Spiroplasma endosymbiont of Clivina fossor]|uniref:hypothetical protein n=1 Tax=Spiroplasma endosymbiont of Clivina fossor TaxID=3066282 RepID=UPI00313BFCEB
MRKICKILGLLKSTYYYQANKCTKFDINNYEQEVISAFNKSRKIYGARKIKAVLNKKKYDLITTKNPIHYDQK